MLLVHGLSGSHRWWRHVHPAGTTARAVDLPRRLAPADVPAWLAASLDAPTVVVGHSLGGLAAARLAAEHPELVEALVLVAPVGVPQPLPGYVKGFLRTVRDTPPSLLAAIVADALRTGLPSLARGAWIATHQPFAGAIGAPTLLVWGERDRLVPVELAERWLEAIPRARLEVVPRVGHVPMLEAPSRFAELLQQFLDDLDDRLGM
jgi:pimeloyl-ACP methyl ester carboxylesterase